MPAMGIPVIILSAALFFAFVISLAAKPKFVRGLTCAALFLAGFGGLLLYGYGYALVSETPALAVVRATLATCGMLLGKNDYSAVSAAPFFQLALGRTVFWLFHLLALYATASATITTLGAGLLQKIRIWLTRRGDLILIYGIHPGSILFGRQMLGRKGASVVFVDEKPEAGLLEQLRTSGGVARSDGAAVAGEAKFVRSLGLRSGRRRVWLYAMHREPAQNLRYAGAFLGALEAEQIRPEQTGLVLFGMEEGLHTGFLAEAGHYGYGNVTVIDEAQMAARRLIREYPPAKTVAFDATGRAGEDLDCLLCGFGAVGQAVLQQLVLHGQFCGSTFHCTVFDPKCSQLTGRLCSQSQALLDDYDIRFEEHDARSGQMYAYLDQHLKRLNYVAVCTGSDKGNQEIAGELLRYFSRRGLEKPVYLCSYSGVQRLSNQSLPQKWELYSKDILWQNGLDRMAMAVNQTYCRDNGRTMEQNWADCDYFSRMSSRGFADFIPSMIHIAGLEQLPEDWQPAPALLENLAITEHMRWCAFHYAMGYSPMPEKVFRERSKAYAEEKARTGSSRLRIGKDPVHRLHACLVPWDGLDALSQAENACTGGSVDYKAMDRNNVLAMPQILAAAREEEEGR